MIFTYNTFSPSAFLIFFWSLFCKAEGVYSKALLGGATSQIRFRCDFPFIFSFLHIFSIYPFFYVHAFITIFFISTSLSFASLTSLQLKILFFLIVGLARKHNFTHFLQVPFSLSSFVSAFLHLFLHFSLSSSTLSHKFHFSSLTLKMKMF